MKLLDLLRLKGSAVGERVIEARERVSAGTSKFIKAFYDAAEPGGVDEEHWSVAGSISARQANSAAVRETLRNRGRYEVANNTIARGMIDTLADDTIGDGPRLQVMADTLNGVKREEAQQIERAFAHWADATGLWNKLRTMRKARAHDGEIFAVRSRNDRQADPVKLNITLVEAERVTDPTMVRSDPLAVDGIKFDLQNNPISYRVLRHHPDDALDGFNPNAFDIIEADNVIHYFRQDRPGQVRGIPEITPALPLFAKMRRFTSATLSAAETAAKVAKVIYTDNPVDSEGGTDANPYEVIDIPENGALALPDGWKIGGFKAEHPITTFDQFRRAIAGEIGRCLGMPVNIVLADSSQHNYSSAMLDHRAYFHKIRVDRDELRITVLDGVFRWWLSEAVLVEGLLPQSARRAQPELRVLWTWPIRGHADPAKEATGMKLRMEAGVTNLAIECAALGLEWQDVLEQRKEIEAYTRELGLGPAAPSTPTPSAEPVRAPGRPGDQPAPEEDDDEA